MGSGQPRPIDVATLPYPGLATDYLPMLVALLSYSSGTSYATENVFSGRFRYVGELARMGARRWCLWPPHGGSQFGVQRHAGAERPADRRVHVRHRVCGEG